LTANFLDNISAKNYHNQLMYVEVVKTILKDSALVSATKPPCSLFWISDATNIAIAVALYDYCIGR